MKRSIIAVGLLLPLATATFAQTDLIRAQDSARQIIKEARDTENSAVEGAKIERAAGTPQIRYRPNISDFRLLDPQGKKEVEISGPQRDESVLLASKSGDWKELFPLNAPHIDASASRAWRIFGKNGVSCTSVLVETSAGQVIFSEYRGDFGRRTNAILVPRVNDIQTVSLTEPSSRSTVNGQIYRAAAISCPDCVTTRTGHYGSYPGKAPSIDAACYARAYAACAVASNPKQCIAAAAIACATLVDTCISCGDQG